MTIRHDLDLPVSYFGQVVPAEIIGSEEFWPLTFAVHRGVGIDFNLYMVSNIETGFRIGPGGRTKKAAIRNAFDRMRNAGFERTMKAARKANKYWKEAKQ